MLKIGLIINPVAGIGGKVGLKGSDGEETLKRARALGACPESGKKASHALKELAAVRDRFVLYTGPGEMGGDLAAEYGLDAHICGVPCTQMTGSDTVEAAKKLLAEGIDLLVFAGGDGTARNILDAVHESVPVLGIPTGCKIHSAVFAINPRRAGQALRKIVETESIGNVREAEVMDIDESLFREGIVQARLYGYLRTPEDKQHMQNLKSGRGLGEEASVALLANCLVDSMKDDVLYIIGSGSTMKAVKEKLGIGGTLLGVDIVYQKKALCMDAGEKQILEMLEAYPKAKVMVTVIGGQGYLFGRGNQQLSAAVLCRVGKKNIIVAMSKNKADSLFLKNLYIDTSDEQTDCSLCGYYRVVVGYDQYVMFQAVN